MRTSLLFLILIIVSTGQTQTLPTSPWPDGEKLTYLIEYGPLDAAEAIFTAKKEPKREGVERFELYLRSRGPIEAFYPIRSRLTSLTQLQPWRTLEYIQDRSEGGNVRQRRTLPDYSVKLGRFFPAPGKPEENFDLPDGPAEDFGSMLYHVRAYPWKVGESITWNVLENKEPLFSKMTCQQIGTLQIEDDPPRPLIEILGQPFGPSTRHQGWLKLWMTDDARRIPVLAKLKFQYGTFLIRLIRGGGPSLDFQPDGQPVPIISESDPSSTP